MEIIFLQDSSHRLSLHDGQLIESSRDQAICSRHPICGTELIEVYGNAQITTQAIKECLKEGIRINYYTSHGKYLGRLEPGYPKNTQRRLAQYGLYFAHPRRLLWCKKLLGAKLQGELIELRRLHEQGISFPYSELCHSLQHSLAEVEHSEELPQLLGIEGMSARRYYEVFRHALPPGILWQGRSHHPPKDGINALLSIIYTLVAQKIRCAIEHWSLDPHCSFLHEPGYGGGGLAQDLLEPLRATLCDHLALRMMKRSANMREAVKASVDGRLGNAVCGEVQDQLRAAWQSRHHRQGRTPQQQLELMVQEIVKSLENADGIPAFDQIHPRR